MLGKFRQLGQDLNTNSVNNLGMSQTNIAVNSAAGQNVGANAVGAAQKDEWFVWVATQPPTDYSITLCLGPFINPATYWTEFQFRFLIYMLRQKKGNKNKKQTLAK